MYTVVHLFNDLENDGKDCAILVIEILLANREEIDTST